MLTWLRRALWDVVPRDQQDTPAVLRRRQLVTAGFVLLGAIVLGLSLRIEPGSPWFYPATLVLAAIWTVGAVVSGPLHLGRIAYGVGVRRPVITPIAIGLGLAAVFVIGALVVRDLPYLGDAVRSVLDHADQGTWPLLVLITAGQRHRRGAVLPRRCLRRRTRVTRSRSRRSPTASPRWRPAT